MSRSRKMKLLTFASMATFQANLRSCSYWGGWEATANSLIVEAVVGNSTTVRTLVVPVSSLDKGGGRHYKWSLLSQIVVKLEVLLL